MTAYKRLEAPQVVRYDGTNVDEVQGLLATYSPDAWAAARGQNGRVLVLQAEGHYPGAIYEGDYLVLESGKLDIVPPARFENVYVEKPKRKPRKKTA